LAGAPQCGHCPVRGFVRIIATQTYLLPFNNFKDQLWNTVAGHLVAIADPTVYPAKGSRCVRTDVQKVDCLPNGFALVPIPFNLLDLDLKAGEIRTEPVLAGGRVFVATLNGTVVALQPTR
jgi:hypothetical protein